MADSKTSSGLSPKAALWIGILAGGWFATLALIAETVAGSQRLQPP